MAKSETPDQDKDKKDAKPPDGGWRETVESIAMAIILALLFRGFVAEAFVIPTGSMAPTLLGRHKDVKCPQCGKWYKTGASGEQDSEGNYTGTFVTTTTCPICQFTQRLDLFDTPDHGSFSGDRIIVSKFAYEIGEPQRWDVIVFKCPGSATINYIKRLIGLPGERIKVVGGNIHILKPGAKEFQIARKPPIKIDGVMQLVDDTDYIPQKLIDLKWPTRWHEWTQGGKSGAASWKTEDGGKTFSVTAPADRDVWLRYRHLVPSAEDWKLILDGKLPTDIASRRGQLIADFTSYNAWHDVTDVMPRTATLQRDSHYSRERYDPSLPEPGEPPSDPSTLGIHWVDDIAVECLANIQSESGEITLDLVHSGVHHRARIDIASGKARLTMTRPNGEQDSFVSDDGQTNVEQVTAQTSVRGNGKYRLRMSNFDRQTLLWVNGSVASFDGPTTYQCNDALHPYWSPNDPLDLEPAAVGVKGAQVHLGQLRIYRDIYYTASSRHYEREANEDPYAQGDYTSRVSVNHFSDEETPAIQALLASPERWESKEKFFTSRKSIEFQLAENEFFPMGDNSTHSLDARLWGAEPHVHRDLLIGRAMFVYWPHTWNTPVPFTPNPAEMRRIR